MTDDTDDTCRACNGHGTDDGQPCGTNARDFGPEAPGPCAECGGTGNRDLPLDAVGAHHLPVRVSRAAPARSAPAPRT